MKFEVALAEAELFMQLNAWWTEAKICGTEVLAFKEY